MTMYQEDIKSSVIQSPSQFIWYVKDQQVVSCPLGGSSVEYIIEINTSRCEFKTSMQSESSVVNFTILKTFKEVEYFYNKLKSHHLHLINFPDFFLNGKSHLINSNEERLSILNKTLKLISDQKSLMIAREFLDFLDFDLKKQAIDVRCQKKSEDNSLGNRKLSSEEKIKKSSQMKITREMQRSENLFGSNGDQDISDDDEDLFKQIKSVNTSEKSQINTATNQSDGHLMYERQDFGDGILKHEKNLFMPLNTNTQKEKPDKPSQSLEEATELLRVDDSLSDIFKEFHKKPEKPPVKAKPAIKPKPNINISKEKAIVCDRPQGLGSTKKPVPPPRTTLSAKGQSSPATSPLTETQPSTTSEINILDYINKEENALKENLDLF